MARELHRWALVRPVTISTPEGLVDTLKTHATALATTRKRAEVIFKSRRNDKPISSGWKIEDRGPVKVKAAPVLPKLKLKVGDVVRIKRPGGVDPVGKQGVVIKIENGYLNVENLGDFTFTPDGVDKWLELVEPAINPKHQSGITEKDLPKVQELMAEAQATIKSQAETIGTLTAERNSAQDRLDWSVRDSIKMMSHLQDALHMPSASWNEMMAEISRLYVVSDERGQKLEDIHSIIRCGNLMTQTGTEDPSLIDTMAHVLAR